MTKAGARSWFVLAIVAAVSLTIVALASPAADAFRQSIAPRLPLYVILLAIISGIAQLVSALIDLLSRSFERHVIALRFTLAASALLLALAFAWGRRPLLPPLIASATLAVVAAAIARRSRQQAVS